jgi:hypothetical protein
MSARIKVLAAGMLETPVFWETTLKREVEHFSKMFMPSYQYPIYIFGDYPDDRGTSLIQNIGVCVCV